MKQSRAKLAQTIADRTLKSGFSKKLSRELAAYLLSERRTSDLDSILRDIQADWAEAGHVEVIAESAHPLPLKVRADIERRVRKLHPSAKSILVTEVINPGVVGGVRLSLPNRQLDLSVEAKLNKFKQLTSAGKE